MYIFLNVLSNCNWSKSKYSYSLMHWISVNERKAETLASASQSLISTLPPPDPHLSQLNKSTPTSPQFLS